MEPLVTLADAAATLGVPYAVAYKRWYAGLVPHVREGRRILVTMEDARAALASYHPQKIHVPVMRQP